VKTKETKKKHETLPIIIRQGVSKIDALKQDAIEHVEGTLLTLACKN
jgi:hypothetical protein